MSLSATLLPISLVTVTLAATVFMYFVWRLVRRQNPSDAEIEWLNEFTIETYQPMGRLLDENDYEFLSRQPGYHPGIAQELRAERYRIFRTYLHSLVHDFNTLIRLAKFILVHSQQDRPDFARHIFRIQLRFYWAVGVAECRLLLSPLPLGSIQVNRLIESLAMVHKNVGKAAMRAIPAS